MSIPDLFPIGSAEAFCCLMLIADLPVVRLHIFGRPRRAYYWHVIRYRTSKSMRQTLVLWQLLAVLVLVPVHSMQAQPRKCGRAYSQPSDQTVIGQKNNYQQGGMQLQDTFALCLHGDENCHYLTDEAGFVVVQDSDNRLVYAQKASENEHQSTNGVSGPSMLAPTELLVGKDTDTIFSDSLLTFQDMLEICSKRMQTLRTFFQQRSPATTSGIDAGRTAVAYPTGKYVAKWRNLVIPVRFSDHRTRALPTRRDIEQLFNPPGNTGKSNVQDWFLANSYGRFHLHSVVTDWIDLEHRESYYTTADGYLDYDKMEELVTEALNKLDQNEQFDFDSAGKEHSDGDYIGVTLLHSGYGGEFDDPDCQTGALPTRRIWSHQWRLSWASARFPNIRLEQYAISSSMYGSCGSELQHLISVVHEIGHLLGLRDMIGPGNSNGSGVGAWDVMGNAWGWTGTAEKGQLSAYTKIQLGWVEPKILSANGEYTIRPSASHSDIYRISAGFPSASEYLLVESRQPVKQDGDLEWGGLAIWHVDETRHFADPDLYPGHEDYPVAHGRVVLLQADGNYDLQRRSTPGDSGDLYRRGTEIGPGQSPSIWSSDIGPYPNTDSYLNGEIKQTGIRLYDISDPGETMQFSFSTTLAEDGAQLSPGNPSEASQVSSQTCNLDVGVSCHLKNTDIECEHVSLDVAQTKLDPVCVGIADISVYVVNNGDNDKQIDEANLFVGGQIQSSMTNFTLVAGGELVLETNVGVNFCTEDRSYFSSGRVVVSSEGNGDDGDNLCVAGSSTAFDTGIIGCVNSDQFYEGGFGDCSTYARGQVNQNFCTVDRDSSGNYAQDVCQECGKCKDTKGGVKCHLSGIQFEAGYGSCETYAAGEENHDYCDLDEDYFIDPQGVTASQVCEECGRCIKTVVI